MSFRILDSPVAITSKVLLVALSKYSSSSKCLFKEQEFMWNKEIKFGSVQLSSFGFHQCQDFYSQ